MGIKRESEVDVTEPRPEPSPARAGDTVRTQVTSRWERVFPDETTRDRLARLRASYEALPVETWATSRTTDTSVIEVGALGRIVRKRWRFHELRDRLRGIGRTTAWADSPAAREFASLQAGADVHEQDASGLRYPRPLAVLELRQGGLLMDCLLLLEEVAGARDLATWLRATDRRRARRDVLAQLGRRAAGMHALGIVDGDFHLRNLLVDPELRLWKVDCRRLRTRALSRRRRVYDLASADVGLRVLASRTERARALRAYADGLTRAERHALARLVERLRARLAPDEERRLPPIDASGD